MVPNKFLKTAKALRKRERSFGEAVRQPIVLSLDVSERQFMKGDQKFLCLPTPMHEFWWGELSRSTYPAGDYL